MDQKPDGENSNQRTQAANSLLDTSQNSVAVEHKKGYMMRKCCYESNYKKSKSHCCNPNQTNESIILLILFSAPFGKRSWKMFFCTLRDLVLYLHKDEHGFRKTQVIIVFFSFFF